MDKNPNHINKHLRCQGQRIVIFMLFAVCTICASCKHSLDVTDSQKATISPQAQKVLEDFNYARMPGFMHIKDSQIIGARAGDAAEVAKAKKYAALYGITIRRDTLGGVTVYYLTPRGNYNKNSIGFYTHGGGFVLGTGLDYTAVEFAHLLNTQVVSVDYALAPEAKFPAAVNQCFAAYKTLAQANPTKKLYVFGASAGGTLAITTILEARDNKIKLPVAAALFTPMTDATGNGDSYVANDGRDVLVWRGFIERILSDNIYFAKGTDLKNPLLSPINADYSKGFVPSILITGTRDLLLSNTVRFHQKLKTNGVQTELLVFEGMWHSFSDNPDVPEGQQANDEVAGFLKSYLE